MKIIEFQSSVRINVGPNCWACKSSSSEASFQSSVRINVGPNPPVRANIKSA